MMLPECKIEQIGNLLVRNSKGNIVYGSKWKINKFEIKFNDL